MIGVDKGLSFNGKRMKMLKNIVISTLCITSSFANEYFIDIMSNNSVIQNRAEYNYKRTNYEEGGSLEGGFYGISLNVGLSYMLAQKIVIEPSFGVATLTNGGNTDINAIYSIELPLLYKVSSNKYGFFLKYNYLTDMSISGISNEKIQLKNQNTFSLGLKAIFDYKYLGLILSYQYMLPGVYQQTIVRKNEIIYTKIDIEGSYISAGLRFKF